MEQSPYSGVVATLNTKAECRVVASGIDRARYEGDEQLQDLLSKDLSARFHSEAKTLNPTASNLGLVDYEWSMLPFFDIHEGDVPFVLAAADRVISDRNPLHYAANRLSGKTRAAKRIAKVLEATRPTHIQTLRSVKE